MAAHITSNGTHQADKRSCLRLRPRGVVSLAIHQGARIPPAYGIVTDISERGLGIDADRVLARGQALQLRIQFQEERDLFEADGTVAWTHPMPALAGREGCGGLSGVELRMPSLHASTRLRQVLRAPAFGLSTGYDEPFEELLVSLQPYLERLGASLEARARARGQRRGH